MLTSAQPESIKSSEVEVRGERGKDIAYCLVVAILKSVKKHFFFILS